MSFQSPTVTSATLSEQKLWWNSASPTLERVQHSILTSERQIVNSLRELDPSSSLAATIESLHSLELLPLITGSRLRDPIQLLIRVNDDLSELELCRIKNPPLPEALDKKINPSELEVEVLAKIPDPNLLYSINDISQYGNNSLAKEQIGQLFSLGRRLTEYRGVLISWDQSVDRRVWTTNIDTLNIINAMSADGVFDRSSIRRAIEIGVGGGGISKTLVQKLPNLYEMIATDISAYALMCARRNITPVLTAERSLTLYLGKGLRELDTSADLIVVNPPYIPHLLKPDSQDPYRGTGLIKEIVDLGRSKLNQGNPEAAIYLGMSSLAEKDLQEYLLSHPEVNVSPVGERKRVPLKILAVNENKEWIDFLIREHGLIYNPDSEKSGGFPFWHEIYTLKLQ